MTIKKPKSIKCKKGIRSTSQFFAQLLQSKPAMLRMEMCILLLICGMVCGLIMAQGHILRQFIVYYLFGYSLHFASVLMHHHYHFKGTFMNYVNGGMGRILKGSRSEILYYNDVQTNDFQTD